MHNLDVRKTEKDGFVNIEEGTSSLKKKRREEHARHARTHFLNTRASGLKSSFDSLLVTEVGTTSLGVGFCVRSYSSFALLYYSTMRARACMEEPEKEKNEKKSDIPVDSPNSPKTSLPPRTRSYRSSECSETAIPLSRQQQVLKLCIRHDDQWPKTD